MSMPTNEYIIIKTLTKTDMKEITLIMHRETKVLYVMKKMISYKKAIYDSIQKLRIPNVPEIISIHESSDGNELCIIEKFINAPTLNNKFDDSIPDIETTVSIIKDICLALDIMHSSKPQIIHRDVTINNIIYDNEKAYLIDFDISRFYIQTKKRDTNLLGTQGFVAPESRGYNQSGSYSDIYSVGVVFHWLLTGYYPHEYEYRGEYTSILSKMLHIDPIQRPSAKEVVQLLDKKNFNIFNAMNTKSFLFFILGATLFGLFIIFFVEYENEPIFTVFLYKMLLFSFYVTPISVSIKIRNSSHYKKTNLFVMTIFLLIYTLLLLFIQLMIVSLLISCIKF